MRAIQKPVPSNWLEPLANYFVRPSSPLTNSRVEVRTPPSNSSGLSVSSRNGQPLDKIEAGAENNCKEEQSDTTLWVNNIPLTSQSQFNDNRKDCNLEVAKLTVADYTPTYQEMADRASPSKQTC
jgi:hypothetical protein